MRAADPPPFTAAQLDQMLASIALFPDALLSQVLMASTYPSDVAEAVDWAYAHRDKFEGDAAVEAVRDKPWDPSVQSLVAFPQVLAMFGENPQWVRDLGDAFLAQPGEVMDSVQFLRSKAKAAGNLESNEQQRIAIEPAPPPPQVIVVNAPPPPTQIITIVPTSPQVVFVPSTVPSGRSVRGGTQGFRRSSSRRRHVGAGAGGGTVHVGIWWGPRIHVSNSLWGGVHWHRRDVNINVNRWNTINVNHRIDSRDRDVSWRHDVRNRHGTPYRGAATRDRLQPAVGDSRGAVETVDATSSGIARARSWPIAWARRTSTVARCAALTATNCRNARRPGTAARKCAIARPASIGQKTTASTAAGFRPRRRGTTAARSRIAPRMPIVRKYRIAPPPAIRARAEPRRRRGPVAGAESQPQRRRDQP